MSKENAIKIFEQKQVRTHWDEEQEKWYFSVVDVVAVLTGQPTHQGARNYWKVLKNRLVKEGNETVTNCNRLKMRSADGKFYNTDSTSDKLIFNRTATLKDAWARKMKRVI